MIVAQVFGIEQGALVLALRAVLWCAVAVAAWRVAGERGEVLRDLLMHPRARAVARAELDVLTALPRLLASRARDARTGHDLTVGPSASHSVLRSRPSS